MRPMRQEDGLGCAVACVAFVLQVSYRKALTLFAGGGKRVKEKANFYCPEIVRILNKAGLNYSWKQLTKEREEEIYNDFSIVFIKKSAKYPFGHFLSRYKNKWMDSWINLPDKNIKAGFREELLGEPTHIIYPARLG